MGISSFSPGFSRTTGLAFFLAPLHALVSLFMPVQNAASICPPSSQTPKNRPSRQRAIDKASWRLASGENAPNLLPAQLNRPSRLKVVREFEPGVGRSCAGRMVISGRMADVCAELERMAQQEVHTGRH